MDLSAEEKAAVQFIAQAYRGGAPIRTTLDAAEASYGALGWHSSAAQRHLLAQTVFYIPTPPPSTSGFSFGSRRISRFVRLLLDQVERSGASIPDGQLIELAATHALKSVEKSDELVHIVVNGPDGRDIILRTSCGKSRASNDLGLRLWEGGVVAFLAILKSPVLRCDIVEKNILELGSGLGLTAYALAAVGASRVVLSDNSPAVLEVLRANVRRIGSTSPPASSHSALPEFRVAKVNVCERSFVSRICEDHSISTILLSDLTYDPDLAIAVTRAIETVVCAADAQGKKVVAYLFCTKRTESVDRTLRDALGRTALNIEEIPLSIDSEGLQNSSFATLLACNKTWDFTKVKLYRLT